MSDAKITLNEMRANKKKRRDIAQERAQKREILREVILRESDHVIEFKPPEVSLHSTEDAYRFPGISKHAARSGVYFIWHGDSLVYIGSSENVYDRVKTHIDAMEMEFNWATFLAIPSPWHLTFEALFIRKLRPTLNKKLVERCR